MLSTAFAPHLSLRDKSRVPVMSHDAGVSVGELACLLACGALAALAVGMLHLSLRVPGHAILRGVLPMAMGLALVPRRSAGTVMTMGSGITAAAMSVGHFGTFSSTALLSVLALGPVLDIALLGRPQGWRLYARFVVAGATANLLAFALKVASAQLGLEMAGSGQFMSFGWLALVSFVLCGALAGLVSAAVCFRLRGDDDLRRN